MKLSVDSKIKIAKILLIVLLASVSVNIYKYFQIKFDFSHVNPLIPKDAFLLQAEPYLSRALVSSIGAIISLIFYFYSKNIVSILISIIAIIMAII